MKIRVVIPVARPGIIQAAQEDYAALARPGTEISVILLDQEGVSPEAQPHESLVIPEILHKVVAAEQEGMDAVVIDCMLDPGMEAARQLVSIPVVGPGETAFHLAASLAFKFSIVYPDKDAFWMEERVAHYGLSAKLASVRVMDFPIEEIERDKQRALGPLVEASAQAVREDGAHIIVPGCTAMVGLATQAQERLAELGCPVPVIDPPWAAVRRAESLVDMGLSHSKRTYPSPQRA